MSSADRLLVDGYNAIEADIFFPRTTDDNFSENSTTDSPATTSFPSSEPNVGLIVGLSVTVACLIACLGLLIHFRSKWLKFCKPCGCSCSCFCSGSRKAETSNQEFVESQVHSSPYPPNSHQPVPTVSATVDHLLDSPVPAPRTNPQITRPKTETNFMFFSSGINSNLSSESHNSNIYKSSPPNSFTNNYKLEPYAPPSTNSGVLLAPPIPPKSINRADRATPFTAGVTISQEIFMSLVTPDSDRDTELHRNEATAPRGLPLPKYPLGSPLTSMNAEILAEFNRLHFKEKPTTVALLPENHFKNRYSDTIPYDENRVIVSTGQYINASHIDHNFIVAQDPIQASGDVDLFWTMIWEKNIHIIVRLSSDDFSLAYMPLDKRWVLENCLQVSPLLGPTDEPQSYTHRVVKLATTRV
ncbi:uncharacterized protein LOC108673277 [Hyalella azteca]|uniref:Uncharacterized protein LOC108673277 n=1 Tax=Hyalella azteca TaxID=294128 RepID=A0A8B7NUB0_HYAAZ|nr:uncharacterized protein LOC108673277 [Hyalella azteca]